MNLTCNTTSTYEKIVEQPLWHVGSYGVKFHHVGLLVSAITGLFGVVVALYLIIQHATHYSKPWEQRHIIRIIFMIPIYSTVSFLSYVFYTHAIYYEVLRDCYEAFAIASFFTLLCHYIAPTLHEQKIYFRTLVPENWFWGIFGLQKCTGGENKGPFRRPRSGLTWFNVIWIGVFQYCLIRVFFTIVSVVTQALGRFCHESLSPVFANIWVKLFEAASVTIAMTCIIQFYIQLKPDLAEHRPFMKVLCIKLVIFLSFWQSMIISFLSTSRGPLLPTKYIAYPDIAIGIPSMLLCIEMAIFSILHLYAYPWKQYSIKHSHNNPLSAVGSGFSGESPKYKGGPLGLYAYADAFNPWDIIKASARGLRWLFVGSRKRHLDSSYHDSNAKLSNQERGYTGPVYAGSGAQATELRPSKDDARTMRPDGAEDDRVNLLSHAQTNPHAASGGRAPSSSPYRTPEQYRTDSNDEYATGDENAGLDLGSRRPGQGQDTGYYGAGPGVDHWASPTDTNNVRPPTYRTNEPNFQ